MDSILDPDRVSERQTAIETTNWQVGQPNGCCLLAEQLSCVSLAEFSPNNLQSAEQCKSGEHKGEVCTLPAVMLNL